jgi:hypothetical protein
MDDAAYHAARVEAELRLAAQAKLPRVRNIHLELARLHRPQQQQGRSITLRDLLRRSFR